MTTSARPERIFRIRKCWSYGGGRACYYYHADIIAPTKLQALKAAVQGRIPGWRWLDSYDWSDKPYESHFFLSELIEGRDRIHPVRPVDKLGHFKVDLPLEERESWSSYLNPDGPTPKQVAAWLKPLKLTATK